MKKFYNEFSNSYGFEFDFSNRTTIRIGINDLSTIVFKGWRNNKYIRVGTIELFYPLRSTIYQFAVYKFNVNFRIAK